MNETGNVINSRRKRNVRQGGQGRPEESQTCTTRSSQPSEALGPVFQSERQSTALRLGPWLRWQTSQETQGSQVSAARRVEGVKMGGCKGGGGGLSLVL